MTMLTQRLSPLVSGCLLRIAAQPRNNVATALTPCGVIENILCAALGRFVYFEGDIFLVTHQWVICTIEKVLRILRGLGRQSLVFRLTCSQSFGTSGGDFK
jgi:hypothetical protein